MNTNYSILSLKPLVYSHIHILAILKFNFLWDSWQLRHANHWDENKHEIFRHYIHSPLSMIEIFLQRTSNSSNTCAKPKHQQHTTMTQGIPSQATVAPPFIQLWSCIHISGTDCSRASTQTLVLIQCCIQSFVFTMRPMIKKKNSYWSLHHYSLRVDEGLRRIP